MMVMHVDPEPPRTSYAGAGVEMSAPGPVSSPVTDRIFTHVSNLTHTAAGEQHGISVLLRDSEQVFCTYFTECAACPAKYPAFATLHDSCRDDG